MFSDSSRAAASSSLPGIFSIDRDALNPEGRQSPDQLAHRRAGLAHRQIADDELLAKDADHDRRIVLVQRPQRLGKRIEVAHDDGVIWRVQVRASQRRAEAAEQIVGQLEARRRI
jgi:hypothetical protein